VDGCLCFFSWLVLAFLGDGIGYGERFGASFYFDCVCWDG
jgi:hypothetical protein